MLGIVLVIPGIALVLPGIALVMPGIAVVLPWFLNGLLPCGSDEVMVCSNGCFEGCVVCRGLAVSPYSLESSACAFGFLEGGGEPVGFLGGLTVRGFPEGGESVGAVGDPAVEVAC